MAARNNVDRYAKWAWDSSVAFICAYGVLANMARKPIESGGKVAAWGIVAMGLNVVVVVDVEGGLVGGEPPWGRLTALSVLVGMAAAVVNCFDMLRWILWKFVWLLVVVNWHPLLEC